MSITWKLALSYAAHHPMRMLLTSLAMIASACIVVWVVSGYDALSSQFGEQASEYLGRYDFFVVPEDPKNPTIDPALIVSLQRDSTVAEVAPVAQVETRLVNPNAAPGGFGGPGQNMSPRPLGEGPGVRTARDKTQGDNAVSVNRPHPNPLPK
ncbi:MAG TPA: hypothetical protein VJL29_09580, partial [Thermoguttaceae bacterium]|nr:hypothetical protein [Thermoguttaceae bacterium]